MRYISVLVECRDADRHDCERLQKGYHRSNINTAVICFFYLVN